MSSGKASEFDLQSNVVRLSVVIRIVNVKLPAGLPEGVMCCLPVEVEDVDLQTLSV